jgi:hypothetical protein
MTTSWIRLCCVTTSPLCSVQFAGFCLWNGSLNYVFTAIIIIAVIVNTVGEFEINSLCIYQAGHFGTVPLSLLMKLERKQIWTNCSKNRLVTLICTECRFHLLWPNFFYRSLLKLIHTYNRGATNFLMLYHSNVWSTVLLPSRAKNDVNKQLIKIISSWRPQVEPMPACSK